MPQPDSDARIDRVVQSIANAGRNKCRREFLRCSHIFSSSVRAVLEEKYLRVVSPSALSAVQLNLLRLIALNGSLRVGDVASVVGLSPAGVTKNVDKLERLGLLVRRSSKKDRRVTILSISRRGDRLVQRYEGLAAERLGPVLEQFSDEEVALFTHLAERFSASLVSQEDSGTGSCLRCAGYCAPDCAVGGVRGGCPCGSVLAGRASGAPEKGSA